MAAAHHHQPQSLEEVRTLWIGDLQIWVDETYLHSCFAHTAQVISVKVIRSKLTGHPEGYGFVEFVSHQAAERVLQSYNGTTMPGTEQPFRLNWASFGTGEKRPDAGPEHSIFVGDLAPDITDYLLQETFRAHYPSVRGAKVVTDPSTGCSKGYGFVKFAHENEKNRAMTEMNRQYCLSRPMRISAATPKKTPGFQQQYVAPKSVTMSSNSKGKLNSGRLICAYRCGTMGTNLPLDVIIDILVCLPVKSLLRFKSVSKEWFNLINHPHFIQLHLLKSNHLCNANPSIACFHNRNYDRLCCLGDLDSLRWDPTEINQLPPIIVNNSSVLVGSCNGLLCFSHFQGRRLLRVVCNPSTGTFREIISHQESLDQTLIYYSSCGFGYDCENDDYKIVLMNLPYGKVMSVYSLKHNLWTKHSSLADFTGFSARHSVFANKRLHWVVGTVKKSQIARFNLCSEQWEELLLAPINNYVHHNMLTVLDGCLGFCSHKPSIRVTDIWIMKEYGVQESWIKLASVPWASPPFRPFVTPIEYSRSKSKLLCVLYRNDIDSLFWYDINQKSFMEVQQSSLPVNNKKHSFFLPYTRSLVLIP